MPHPSQPQPNKHPRRSRSLPVKGNREDGSSDPFTGAVMPRVKDTGTRRPRGNRRRSFDSETETSALNWQDGSSDPFTSAVMPRVKDTGTRRPRGNRRRSFDSETETSALNRQDGSSDSFTSAVMPRVKDTGTRRPRGNRPRSFDGETETSALNRHNTRGTNGTTKMHEGTEAREEKQLVEETQNEEFDQEIEDTAFRLSSLDQQAHAESQILDANRLCRELLVPLALPWNYPEQALDATTPLDLDDLPMLAEDELGDHEISRSVLESTDAVGVMHLNSYVVHPSHFRALNHLVPSDPSSAKIENFAGKMALTQYEAVMSRKRKMEELESPASFPWSEKVGKPQRGPDALVKARSKDGCSDRWPSASTVVDGILEEKEWLPRNCLKWLDHGRKDDANDKISRSTVRRTLKKPLVARVSLRINGKLLSSNDASMNQSFKSLMKSTVDSQSKSSPASVYTEVRLDDILQALSDQSEKTTAESSSSHMQCSLNADALFQNATHDIESIHRRGENMNAARRLRQPLCFSIQTDSQFLQKGESGSARTVGFQPPHLDCFGTVDGLLRVSCTKEGSFFASSDLSFAIFQEFAVKYNRCFICWGSCEGASVVRCSVCSISVHRNCVRLSNDTKSKWVCHSCEVVDDEGSNRSSVPRKCSRCPLPSGLLRTTGSSTMHHLCATWGDETRNKTSKCCLCSRDTGSLVECAADGCRVEFHPNCAAVASAFGDLDNPSGGDDDVHLCSQYTLSMVETSPMGNNQRTRIPVAFCGYHNPKRSETFLGLYPEGCYLDPEQGTTPALRIPPIRALHVVSNDEGNESE